MKIRILLLLSFIATSLISCGGADNAPPAEPITIKFTVANLPEMLPVNRETIPDGVKEYAWTVIFDMDNNGSENEGDLQIGLIHNKSNLAFPHELPIELFTVSVTRDMHGETDVYFFGSKDVQVSGNTIVIHIPKNQIDRIVNIENAKQVYFKTTAIDDLGNSHHDYYPAQDTFINIPTNGKFTDDTGEASTGGQQHIDIRARSL